MKFGQGVKPRRYALGATAALARIDPSILDSEAPVEAALDTLWRAANPAQGEMDQLISLMETARGELKAWRSAGFPDLEALFQ